MKSIINGLRYDTDKAILIGEASEGYAGDFGRWEAGLYRTPRAGRYFLAGNGGPMSRWAKRDGNMWGGSSRIFPMDLEEAREWAERYLTTEQVEAAFSAELQDA